MLVLHAVPALPAVCGPDRHVTELSAYDAHTFPQCTQQDETLIQVPSRGAHTMSLDEDTESTDDEEERAEKRVKLTEATEALGLQVAALQVSCCFTLPLMKRLLLKQTTVTEANNRY